MDTNHDSESYQQSREKLLKAIETFVEETDSSSPMLLGASVVFEVTTYDGDMQVWSTHHVMVGTAAMNFHVGMLTTVQHRLLKYMNRGYGHLESD